jgi:hypothetical protein
MSISRRATSTELSTCTICSSLSNRSAPSVLVGALFKKFGLFSNTEVFHLWIHKFNYLSLNSPKHTLSGGRSIQFIPILTPYSSISISVLSSHFKPRSSKSSLHIKFSHQIFVHIFHISPCVLNEPPIVSYFIWSPFIIAGEAFNSWRSSPQSFLQSPIWSQSQPQPLGRLHLQSMLLLYCKKSNYSYYLTLLA